MLKKIICFTLSILTILPLLGCVNDTSEIEATTTVETTEVIVEETVMPTVVFETQPEETEPSVPLAPNGEEITEILHLKLDALNVRSKPFTSARIVGIYRAGDEIIVTGRSDNGWLKVCYTDENGDYLVGYCANGYSYFMEPWPGNTVKKDSSVTKETESIEEPTKPAELEETKPVETMPSDQTESDILPTEPSEITEPTEPSVEETTPPTEETVPENPMLQNQGTYGRLTIPDIDASCQLNIVDTSTTEATYLAQHYTDLEDSAAFFQYGKMYIISDHKEQSFARLEDVGKNTIAYIGTGDNIIELYCYKTRYGKNGLNSLKTDHNESGTGFDGYLMYTFSDTKDGYDIYMTYWREKTW